MSRFILIIEDTASLAASLGLAFEGMIGLEAAVFGNAREALRFLQMTYRPLAAVITDLNLPDEDGFSLIRQIRQLDRQYAVPAILITAQENPIPKKEDMLGSPNAILKKPFSIKEVRRVLETLL